MAVRSDFEKIAKALLKKNMSEADLKTVESLLPKIFAAYERLGDESTSYAALLNQHKDKRRMLESLKDLYEDEKEFTSSSIAVDIRLKKALQKKLVLNVERNNLTEQEETHIKDYIKTLDKSIKSQNKFVRGIQKGEAITDQLLQSTLGISRSWAGEAGSGGIKGAIQGLGRGIKNNLTATNALATIMSFTVGQLVKLDKVRSELFMTTGITDVTGELAGMTADYAGVFGKDAPEAAAEVFRSARLNIRNKDVALGGFQNDAFKQIGLLQTQGVSMDAFTAIYGDFKMALGRTDQESGKIGLRLKKFAKRIKRPPEEIFRETAENLPFLSRYGTEFENTFASLAITGKETNMAISELISLGDSLDSIEMSSAVAAKMNALLGQKVMDVAEFTIAGAEEKAQMIGQGLRDYESQHGQINQRIFRTIAGKIGGMSEAQLLKLKNAGTSGITRELDDVDPNEGIKETIKELESQLSQAKQLEIALAKMGQAFTVKIAQNKTARAAANYTLDNIGKVSAGLIAGVLALKAINAASGIIGSPLRPKRIIDTNPASSVGDIDPRSSRQGGRQGSGRQFRNNPGRFGTGRGRMFIGQPPAAPAPQQSLFQRIAGRAKSGFNYVKSGVQSVNPMNAVRQVGSALRTGALTIGKNLLKFGPIAAVIESVVSGIDIHSAVKGGMKGSELYQYVGTKVMQTFGRVLGGIAGATLLNYLVSPLTALLGIATVGAGAAALATVLGIVGYYFGAKLGDWVVGQIAGAMNPSHIQSLGKFTLDRFYDESEISGSGASASAPRAPDITEGSRTVNTSNDKFVQKKMTPEQSPSDPILASLSELVEIIEKNQTSQNDVILEVGFTRIGTVTV